MTKSVSVNDFKKPTKPINPPFTFRDPNNPSTIFGSADNLCDLCKILPFVPYYSIEFHTHRVNSNHQNESDLSSWLLFVLEEEELAEKVRLLGSKYKGLDLKDKLNTLLLSYCI